MPPRPGAMSPGIVIRYARQEWARGDWRTVVHRIVGLQSHGTDAVNRLRQALNISPARWRQLHRIATTMIPGTSLSPLSLSHHVQAFRAPRLFSEDTPKHVPEFWLFTARKHGWSVRQLRWAMQHPDRWAARALDSKEAHRSLHQAISRYNARHARWSGSTCDLQCRPTCPGGVS